MFGLLFGAASAATTRLLGLALTLGIFLLSRPGGWAVVVAATLVGWKFLKQTPD